MSLSTYLLEYGRHVARLRRRRRRRAYAPTSNTASHDNHKKILHGFPFLSRDDYGAPLGGPLGRRSSAIINYFHLSVVKARRRKIKMLLEHTCSHCIMIGLTLLTLAHNYMKLLSIKKECFKEQKLQCNCFANRKGPCLYTLLISRGAILNVKFMTSFAESNLSSCADFITLDPCLIAQHQISSLKEESKKGQYLS